MPKPMSRNEASTVNETFSDYVARLGADAEPPDDACYEDVREELRTVVVHELRRRGLWRAPPFHVGANGANWADGALDDLVTDAYTFIFLRRLQGLRNQQKLKGNIRPLVVLNVRHFVTERQKKADPLGYRLFGRLRDAIRTVLDRGKLLVLSGTLPVGQAPPADPPRIDNDTVLSFKPGLSPLTPRHGFEEPVRRWNDDLLPDLVTAEGAAVPKVVQSLAEKVLALADRGVAAFRFGDLIAELKDDVRRRWEAIWNLDLGDLALEPGEAGRPQIVRIVEPGDPPDWPRRLVLIQDCVAAAIDDTRPEAKRRDLWSLWLLLRATRLLPGEDGPLPAFAELGRQLKLTRDRVRQLFERLWPIVQNCLQTAGRRTASQTPNDESSDDPERAIAEERRHVEVARQGRRR
jgi:hypothetical protein